MLFYSSFGARHRKQAIHLNNIHPAIFHMLDVAFVAEALLRDGAPRLRQALCTPGRLRCRRTDRLVAVLDCYARPGQDLGAFQGQAKREDARLQRERLIDAGVQFVPGSSSYITLKSVPSGCTIILRAVSRAHWSAWYGRCAMRWVGIMADSPRQECAIFVSV